MQRHARILTVVLLLGGALLGAYFGVRGQDTRAPWPPPPVPMDEESEAIPSVILPASNVAPRATVHAPPAPAPMPKVNTAAKPDFQAPAAKKNVPAPLPAAPPVPNVELPSVSVFPEAAPPAPISPDIMPKQMPNADEPLPAGPMGAPAPPAPALTPLPEIKNTPLPLPKTPAPITVSPGPDIMVPAPTPPTPPAPFGPAPFGPAPVAPAPMAPAPMTPTPVLDAAPPVLHVPATAAPPPASKDATAPAKKPPVVQMPTAVTPFQSPAPAPIHSGAPLQQPDAQAQDKWERPPPFKLITPLRRPSGPTAPLLDPLEKPLAQSHNPPPQHNPPLMGHVPNAGQTPVVPHTFSGPHSGAMTPQVTVEKRGPATLRAGEPLNYLIVVRNVGATAASRVRIEDELPAGARLLTADPQPTFQNDRAVWVLPSLPAGGERQIRLEMQVQNGGLLASNTTVVVSASTATKTSIGHEGLSVHVSGPSNVPLGFPVVFEIKVTNHGSTPANSMVLHGRIPAGLTHPMGNHIEADVGDLAAGGSKTFKMPLTAAQPGKHSIDVKITTAGGGEATALGTVQVNPTGGASLRVTQPGQAKIFMNKEAELRIEVANNLAYGLKNVAVTNMLPEGVEFAGASDRGIYRPETRTVHWLLDKVEPEQARTLVLRVQGKNFGNFTNEVIARTEAREEVQSKGAVQVQGLTALVLKVKGRDSTLEVGRSTVYEITVLNQGSAIATAVQVVAVLPEGMAPTGAKGPAAFRVDGRKITFAAVPKLLPQGQAIYYVNALAQAPGDRRFRAEVVSDQDPLPLAREERTYVYRD